ncbi:MAG TPA: SMC-Scp complex subunit ScpB [Tepidisphaeraceae bacterium]|jgi:segregation and condensation protein B|nr:SMC-Scp complex subunit ScpB [Tepidisphaeraceae bacterium]
METTEPSIDEPQTPVEQAIGKEAPAAETTPEEPTAEEGTAEQRDGAVEADLQDADASPEATAEPINTPLIEALLLGTLSPLTAGRLADLMGLSSTKPVRAGVKALNKQYTETGRAFRIEQVAGGYQILTLPEFGEHLKKLYQKEVDAKLTKAALESLAIIAYKQPILRADIEAVRGVACGETIRSLMEKHLVKIAGRAEEPGRPILYGTTKRFLELFGLNTLKDLPQPENFKAPK